MSEFTTKQIYDLNNMNVAAQNIQLGTVLNSLVGGSFIGGCPFVLLDYTSGETTPQELGEAIESAISQGNIPIIKITDGIYYAYPNYLGVSDRIYTFIYFSADISTITIECNCSIIEVIHDGISQWTIYTENIALTQQK